MTACRVAILGAGLVGRLLAWRLARRGVAVEVYEAGPLDAPRSAAHTAAAMIAPYSEVVVSDRSIFDAGQTALEVWPRWLAELREDGGPQVAYTACGTLALAHPRDGAELDQFQRELQRHLGADNAAVALDGPGVAACEPQLGQRFGRALWLPGEAHLDNRGLLAGLLATATAQGATIHPASPRSPTDLASAQGLHWVVDCRGMGAGAELATLRGVRGEVMWVETREVQLTHALRLMHPRYQLYMVPKPNHRYIIGATEIESEDRSPISLRSLLELGSALYSIHPAFAEARVLELDTNLRPSLPDNLPQLNRQPRLANGAEVLSINGLYRHGYLLAPDLITRAEAQILDT